MCLLHLCLRVSLHWIASSKTSCYSGTEVDYSEHLPFLLQWTLLQYVLWKQYTSFNCFTGLDDNREFAIVEYWIRLRVPMEQALRLYKVSKRVH